MSSIRYIGSKLRLVKRIIDSVGAPKKGAGSFVDVFSGTGIVSREAAIRGWKVNANDYLRSASTLTRAQLLSRSDVPFEDFGGYEYAVEKLSRATPIPGFIYREYTPSGKSSTGHKRLYFSCENGERIDGMRKTIGNWKRNEMLSENEESLLVADLLVAANSVANIAGTYGCFLRKLSGNSLKTISINPRNLLEKRCSFNVCSQDAFGIKTSENDIVYLDPPYTRRQYPAYYHILETIAYGDSPNVSGVTGLRPWKDKSSPFCFKRKAVESLALLVGGLRALRIYLSYSSEGHMEMDDVISTLKHLGRVKVHNMGEIGRYRPNKGASISGSAVKEFLVEMSPA